MIRESQIINFSKDHGLGDETVFDIDEDSQGNIYFATTNGLSVFNVDITKGSIHNKVLPFTNYTTKMDWPTIILPIFHVQHLTLLLLEQVQVYRFFLMV